ncbi:hypothetical protein ACWIGI_28200 [Nocardia sp. NPDC055321]
MRALPEHHQRHSLLPLLHNYQQPKSPLQGTALSTERFRAAVQQAQIPPDNYIPHITPRSS